jgi:hypothetical protein
MKKIYLISTLLFTTFYGFAQYQYQPFPSQSGRWVYEMYSDFGFFLGNTYREYLIDTTDGYMKSTDFWYYEQNKEIYFKYDTGSFKLVYDFKLYPPDQPHLVLAAKAIDFRAKYMNNEHTRENV